MIPVVVRCRPPRPDQTQPLPRARHEAPTVALRMRRPLALPAWALAGGGSVLALVVLAVAVLAPLTVYAIVRAVGG